MRGDPADQPGTRRLEQLDERMVRTATELQAMSEGQLPDSLLTSGEQFDHVEWVEAELADAMDERERMLDTVTALGEVPYTED